MTEVSSDCLQKTFLNHQKLSILLESKIVSRIFHLYQYYSCVKIYIFKFVTSYARFTNNASVSAFIMNTFIAELNVFGLSSGPRQRNKLKALLTRKNQNKMKLNKKRIREQLMHQCNNNKNNDMTI